LIALMIRVRINTTLTTKTRRLRHSSPACLPNPQRVCCAGLVA